MSDVGGIAADQLRSVVERIERLNDEIDGLKAGVKDIYDEAKGNGFEPKIIRQIIRLRKLEAHDRKEQEEMIDLYKSALGMTP